jgi:predicted permease
MLADQFTHDIILGLRLIERNPGFAAVAILTLALGIGANTAIFTALDTLLLRPLPYPQPERLVQISELVETGRPNSVSGGAFLDWREQQTQFDAIALTAPVAFNLRGSSRAERITGLEVSHEFFRVLGVPMRLGRGFAPDDDRPGAADAVIVLTEEFWRSHFGADPTAIGRSLVLDEVPHTIIGVFPAGAWLVRDHRFFVPAVLTPGTLRAARSPHWAAVFGRLRADTTIAQADAELKALKQRLTPLYPSFKAGWSVAVEPAADAIRGATRDPVLTLLAAVSLVLLIACANVANLLIARGYQRQQELAVRTALGATGRRLVRQVLTEHFVLVGLGGLAGVAVAYAGTSLLRYLTQLALPLSLAPRVDERALMFTLAATVVTGVLSGSLPALRAGRIGVNAALTNGSRNQTAGRRRTQTMLVIAEVSFTVVLLCSAGLLMRSLLKTASVDPGFDAAHTLAFEVSLPDATYESRERRHAFAIQLVERLRALPGVAAAGSGMAVPFSGGGFGERFRRPQAPEQDYVMGRLSYASAGFLDALGVRLLEGRRLMPTDDHADGARVVVINDTAARTVFAGDTAVGQPVRIAGQVWQVIGVVADVVDRQLDARPQPLAYAPLAFNPGQLSMVVRTPLDPASLMESIRREVARVDAGVAVADARALDRAMNGSMLQRKVVLGLVATFATAALSLACIGLYGVMAYAVAIRRREFGIRMTLGARRAEIVSDVLRGGLSITAVGLVLGLAATAAAGRLLAGQLFEVRGSDPIALGVTTLTVAAVAMLASLVPALRAASVDPATALRGE